MCMGRQQATMYRVLGHRAHRQEEEESVSS